eukprot:m.14634 g.14634  ORF g.14634 m.14634 type:complete len:59 (-) comp10487_c0_seq1:237-413(-)
MESSSDGSRVIATSETELPNIVDTEDSEEHVIYNTDAADNTISPDPLAVVLDGAVHDA